MSCIDTLVLLFYIGECNCDKVPNIECGSWVVKENIKMVVKENNILLSHGFWAHGFDVIPLSGFVVACLYKRTTRVVVWYEKPG